jgi:MFS family permease
VEGSTVPASSGRIRAPHDSKRAHHDSSGYRAALRTPGALKFYLAAAPARIGLAMTGLGIVWLVHGETGSYATAGAVTGGVAIAEALLGPQVARLIDRFGQSRMLPLTVLVHVCSVAVLIGLTTTAAPLWSMVTAGVAVGGSIPQIGAQTAARWSLALRGSPVLSSAFALEALGTGLAFLVGPALIGTVSSLTTPVAGSILATMLIAAGGLALAAQRRTAPPPAKHDRLARRDRLLRPAFVALIGANVGMGLFFGAMQVAVTAFAIGRGAAGLAGPLYSVTSLVSMIAGLAYGARHWRTSATTQFVLALGLLCLSCLPLLAVDGPGSLALALALPGLALAPYQILSAVLAEARVAATVLTQAFTWLNSGSAAGIAVGAAITGKVVDGNDPRWGFLLAIGATLVATGCGLFTALTSPATRPAARSRR